MTAINLSSDQQERARAVARVIGGAIREAREARGHSLKDAAAAILSWDTTVGNLERGDAPNPKLGTIVKLLDYYGLQLVVVPDPAAPPFVAAVAEVAPVMDVVADGVEAWPEGGRDGTSDDVMETAVAVVDAVTDPMEPKPPRRHRRTRPKEVTHDDVRAIVRDAIREGAKTAWRPIYDARSL